VEERQSVDEVPIASIEASHLDDNDRLHMIDKTLTIDYSMIGERIRTTGWFLVWHRLLSFVWREVLDGVAPSSITSDSSWWEREEGGKGLARGLEAVASSPKIITILERSAAPPHAHHCLYLVVIDDGVMLMWNVVEVWG
jgi:hypothetical protein